MKRYLILLAILALMLPVFAGVYTIGTGTTGSYTAPFNGLWDNSWCKSIYTLAEINAAGLTQANSIIGIGLYVTDTPANYAMNDQRVYVRHSDATNYETTDNDHPDSSLFHTGFIGTLTYNGGGWFIISFPTPFAWNGAQGLEFLFENRDGSWTSGYPNFAYTSTSPNYLMANKAQDGSFPQGVAGSLSYNRPNIQLITPMVDPPAPTTLVAPGNAATMISTNISLAWNPIMGATGYKVYIGTSPTPAFVADVGANTTYSPAGLLNNTTYYWQIVPYNTYGDASSCPVWSFTTAPAGMVTIGTGNVNQYMPVNAYYGYSYSQSIYLQSEINMQDQRIEKIAYYWNGAGAGTNSNQWVVYMGHTDNTAFATTNDWIPITQLSQVYAGTLNIPAVPGWIEITLQSPFVYNNTQNLVIAVDENKPSYDSSSYFFFNTNTPGVNRSIRAYSDSVNPDPANPPTGASQTVVAGYPNIMMQFGDLPANPIFSYNPASLVFDTVYQNTATAWQNVMVTNTGAGTINLAADDISIIGAAAAMFEPNLANLPFSLGPGQSGIIPVRYNPSAAGQHNASLRMVYGGNNYDVALSGYAVASDALLESFEATSFPPAGWANPGTWSRSTSYAVQGTAAAFKSGSATTQYILSTPMLSPTEGSQFRFWSRSSVANSVLQLVYSPDRSTWTQIGSDLSHPTINTWQNNIIDLSSLAGENYYFGIRTGLQSASFYVDLVAGPAITPVAPGTPTLSAPADNATNQSPALTLSWTTPTTGGIVNSYNIYIGTNAEEMTVYGTSTTNSYTVNPPLNWNTTYYWKVSAVNNAGEGVASTARSFTTMQNPTIEVFPWTENFEGATFPPANWARLTGLYPTDTPTSTTSGWISSNFANVATTPVNKGSRLNIWGTGTKYWLVTPPIAIPASGYELKFDLALTAYSTPSPITPGSQADDKFIVLISNNPNMANATVLREWNNTGSEYVYDNIATLGQNIGIDLSAYTGTKYIAFYGQSTIAGGDNSVHIDNVTIREIPANPIFTYTPEAIDFGTVMHDTPSAARNVIVSNNGGGVISLNAANISLMGTNADEFSFDAANLPATLGAGESVNIPVTVTAQNTGALSATLRIVWNATNYDVALSASALPAGIIILGDGTAAQRQPFGTLWGYERSAALYTAAELGTTGFLDMVAWDCAATTTTQVPYKIYMGTTTENALTAQTFSTLIQNLSLVKQGTHVFSNTGWHQFALDSPYQYTGGNLIVAVETNYGGSGGGSGHTFRYTTSATGSHQYWNTDSNPPTSNGTLNALRPNLMLHLLEPIAGPPAAPIMLAPEHNATGVPVSGFNLAWSADFENGGLPDYYAIYLSQDEDSIFDDFYFETSNTYFNPVTEGEMDFGYEETWYWMVQAFNADGDELAERAFKFTTETDPRILSLPYAENFDSLPTGTTFPRAWTAIKTYASSTLSISSTYSQSPSNSVYMYNYSTTETMRLVTPEVLVPMNSLKLSFYLRAGGTANYSFKVGTVPTPDATALFTPVATITPTASSVFELHTVSFANYTGTDRYIAFQHGTGGTYQSFYLDTIYLEQLVANDLAITALSAPGFGVAGEMVNFGVSVYNNGTAAQNAYALQLINADTQEALSTQEIGSVIEPAATETVQLSWIPALGGNFNVQAKVILAEDVNAYNDLSAVRNIQIYPAGTHIPLVGNPATTTKRNSAPFNMYWKCSIVETIYLQSELQMASGTINAIAYKNDFTQTLDKNVKIWMGHTNDIIHNDWQDLANLSLVFSGEVHFPIGVNEIVIPLTTPFQYTGGNLVVRTLRVMDTSYASSSDAFYYTTDSIYPNRIRYANSDTVNYETDVIPAGTRDSNIPNTSFFITPYTALPDLVAPVAELALVSNAPKLSWNAVPGAYMYVVYGSDDPYDWDSATLLTTTANLYYNITPAAARKFYRVAARTYGHQAREWEAVLSPALDFESQSEDTKADTRK